MKKIVLTAAAAMAAIVGAQAQQVIGAQTGEATEPIVLNLTNVLVFEAATSGQATPTITFENAAHYNDANGRTSGMTNWRVKSTKPFNVTARAASNEFTEASGNTAGAQGKTVTGVMSLHVEPGTGAGNATAGYGGTGATAMYGPVSTSNIDILTGGVAGGNQLFSVGYKAKPNWGMQGGNYQATIIYTATQQ